MNRAQPATTRRETTYTDVGNADIAGANICHPWGLGIRIPAADGLSKVPPVHVSDISTILWQPNRVTYGASYRETITEEKFFSVNIC
jgi:hypothetical protein